MYISTFYGVVKQNNGYFKIFYPVYSNGDINPVVNASEFNSFLTARNQADLAYLDLQSVLANVDNISVYGNYELLYENNNYLIQQVVLDVNLNQSSDPDYTNILTSINTNLSNLNTNITNKNNQSDIVNCLKLIFVNRIAGVESSVLKVYSDNDSIKTNSSIPVLLFKLAQLLSSDSNYSYTSSNLIANRVLDNISKKLSNTIPDVTDFNNKSILRAIEELSLKLSFDYPTSSVSDISLYKQLLNIKGSLKDSSDLHTISQAIDLISTAIAQTPTTDTTNLEQGLTEIKESIENKDNVLLVDGTQNFVFRKEEEEE